MANVECKKCGELGNSKCPHCRSIFPSNQVLAVAEHSVNELREEDDAIIITLRLYGETLQDKLETLRWIASQPIGLLCKHQYTFVKGAKSSIDCGHHG